MQAKNLREESLESLNKELTALYREQFNLRMQKGMGETPKTHHYGRVKKTIARIKTIINEREAEEK